MIHKEDGQLACPPLAPTRSERPWSNGVTVTEDAAADLLATQAKEGRFD